MEKDTDVEGYFQSVANLRSQIYKQLSDIDSLCEKTDQITQEILHDYVNEKEKIAAKEMNETDGSTPFKSRLGLMHAFKELPRIDCFPNRKKNEELENNESADISLPGVRCPQLFNR